MTRGLFRVGALTLAALLWMVQPGLRGGVASAISEAHAQDAPVPAASDAYRVDIDAPFALAGVLRQDLDLLRWRTYEGMNRDLLERLASEAQQQLTSTLATEGYFSPTIVRSITFPVRASPVMLRTMVGEK